MVIASAPTSKLSMLRTNGRTLDGIRKDPRKTAPLASYSFPRLLMHRSRTCTPQELFWLEVRAKLSNGKLTPQKRDKSNTSFSERAIKSRCVPDKVLEKTKKA